ncbi:MAG: hypothetical protein AAGA90_11890 [Actinomycetota bacterium]
MRNPSTRPDLDLLEAWSVEPVGGAVPRATVVDRLLDLRNAVEPNGRHWVDVVLASTPGANLVPGSWWSEQIDRLRFDLTVTAVAAETTPTPEDIPHETPLPPNDRRRDHAPAGRWFRRRPSTADDDHRDQRL